MHAALSRLAAFFGRVPGLVREPEPGVTPAVSVARFPPVRAGFIRRLFTPLHDRCVYMTHGMSSIAMPIPREMSSVYPSRIELIAVSPGAYVGGHDGQDMVSVLLQHLATMPFQTNSLLGPLHTATLEKGIGESQMSSVLFGVPERVDMRRLCACTPGAELVVSVMPIAAAEQAYAERHGSERLVDLFEQHRVPNAFDLSRKTVA